MSDCLHTQQERQNHIGDLFPKCPCHQVVPPHKTNGYSPMYKMHKYWARKSWYLVNQYLQHFTREGEVLLDPFCGSGVTGLEAIALSRFAVLVDLNPIATFIANMTATVDFAPYDIKRAFRKISAQCAEKIHALYWLDQTCSLCGGALETRHLLRGPKFNVPIVVAYCPYCGVKRSQIRRELTQKEQDFLAKIEAEPITAWYPRVPFPEKFDKDRITYKGIQYIHQICTPRNLKALSWIREAIDEIADETIKHLLLLAFSNTLLHASKLKAENVRPMAVNNYWVPDDWIEENVWYRFSERVRLVERGMKVAMGRISKQQAERLKVYTHTATDLSMLEDHSIDYIFTDPPYGDSIQYSELSRIWNAWLNRDFPIQEEVIINPTQNKGHAEYETLLTQAFSEMYRVLKPGRWLTLCFHNKSFETWNAILQACRKAKFQYGNVCPQKPLSQSFTQAWAENSPKTDLLINLYKPVRESDTVHQKPQEQAFFSLERLVETVCHELSEHKQSDINLVYDGVVMKLVEAAFYGICPENLNDYSVYKVAQIIKGKQN
ncbi:hypothetical protein HYR99_20515 [Candidatus Poribacteria bacterium]|nr:hypothetical protein [Candidatus Poribacteria bacterium]